MQWHVSIPRLERKAQNGTLAASSTRSVCSRPSERSCPKMSRRESSRKSLTSTSGFYVHSHTHTHKYFYLNTAFTVLSLKTVLPLLTHVGVVPVEAEEDALELELQASVRRLIWVLETELSSSARAITLPC